MVRLSKNSTVVVGVGQCSEAVHLHQHEVVKNASCFATGARLGFNDKEYKKIWFKFVVLKGRVNTVRLSSFVWHLRAVWVTIFIFTGLTVVQCLPKYWGLTNMMTKVCKYYMTLCIVISLIMPPLRGPKGRGVAPIEATRGVH